MEPYGEDNEKILWDTRKTRKVWSKPYQVAHQEENPPYYQDSPGYLKDYWEANLPAITRLLEQDLRRVRKTES